MASSRCTALFYPDAAEGKSRLHFARTLARRAERRLVELAAESACAGADALHISNIGLPTRHGRAEDSDARSHP